MALIVYPLENWDSFVDETRAIALIGGFVSSAGTLAFEALDSTGKEAILRQTALQIRLCPNIILPTDNESNLEYAQCYLTTHALITNMLSFDANDKSISEEHAGEVGVSYDTKLKASDNTEFDPMTKALLKNYGCKSSNRGFSQSYVGRS